MTIKISHWTLAICAVAVACGAETTDTDISSNSPPTAGGGGDTADDTRCLFEVDALLDEVGAEASDRTDCGSFHGSATDAITEAFACFNDELATDGAELTVNNCTDCSILSVYVSTPSAELYHVRMEADVYGDALREASIERCAAVEDHGQEGIECVDAELVYSCRDALR